MATSAEAGQWHKANGPHLGARGLPMLCKGAPGSPSEGVEPADEAAVEEAPKRVLCCRACGVEITDLDAAVSMGGGGPVQVHFNPHGVVFEVLTVLRARNLAVVGSRTTAFTWFPGYAWEIAHCARCSIHLGWRFSATGPEGEPPVFYGLLRARLV